MWDKVRSSKSDVYHISTSCFIGFKPGNNTVYISYRAFDLKLGAADEHVWSERTNNVNHSPNAVLRSSFWSGSCQTVIK